jgi:hypothetical protein
MNVSVFLVSMSIWLLGHWIGASGDVDCVGLHLCLSDRQNMVLVMALRMVIVVWR